MKKILKLSIFLYVFTLFLPEYVSAQNIDPQYIFVRKNPMSCNPSDCSQLWNMDNPDLDFYAGITDVFNKVGTHGNNYRKVGVGVLISYNEYDFNHVQNSLSSLLLYSRTHTVPLFLALDGSQWWDARSDLWNWWDAAQPGYNPANKNNVEWTCASPTCAVKKNTRNWETSIEVAPHLNLASRTVIGENKQRLNVLIQIISQWYRNLPDDKKWLLGGIDLGTEVDIPAQYDYTGGSLGDGKQIGFAAVTTLGLAGGITGNNLNEVVRRYLTELDKLAFDLGIPRQKIFNHTGGVDTDEENAGSPIIYATADAAANGYGNPGWTMYGDAASNPQNFPGRNAVMDKLGSGEWASPEWLPNPTDFNGWVSALRNSLNYRNNRFINIANWEEIRDKQFVLDAIRTVASETASCWVTSPTVVQNVSGNTFSLSWLNGEHNDGIYLNISTSGDLNNDGGYKNINVANEVVTGRSSWSKTMGNGKYYWQLIADGCGNQRRRVYGSFAFLPPSPTNTPVPTGTPIPPTSTTVPLSSTPIPTYSPTPTPISFNSFLNLFKTYYNQPNPPSSVDLNNDGKVDIFDYNKFVGNLGI